MPHVADPSEQKLTEEQISEILSSEVTFAEYMGSLTVTQIDTLLAATKDPMMTKLLQYVRTERLKAEQQIGWKLAPAVTGIATVITLSKQIEALEKIQREIA